MLRSGFRMDWNASSQNTITLQGDIYDGDIDQQVSLPDLSSPPPLFENKQFEQVQISGGNLLARWQHQVSDRADMALQIYYDQARRSELTYRECYQTADIDFHNRFSLGNRQEIIWGTGFRVIRDETEDTDIVSFEPRDRDFQLFTGFIQDEITFLSRKLRFKFGSKFEHNDFTGFEFQPNSRLLWQPHDHHTFWSAVSRAVRTPSRTESDIHVDLQARLVPVPVPPLPVPVMVPALVKFMGSPKFGAEDLLSYELGYRLLPADKVSLDVTAFYNDYRNIRVFSNGPVEPIDATSVLIPVSINNEMTAQTYGIELAAEWALSDRWRLNAAYTNLQLRAQVKRAADQVVADFIEKRDPRHQIYIRSRLDLPANLMYNLGIRYVDHVTSLDANPANNVTVSSYIGLDVRIAWAFNQNLIFSIVGQNLLEKHHGELGPVIINTPVTEIERGVYAKVSCRF